MSLFFLARSGCSERINGRDGEPLRYRDHDEATDAAAFFSDRLGFPVEVIDVEEWADLYHAPVSAAKSRAGSRRHPCRDILEELYSAGFIPDEYADAVENALGGSQ